MKELFQSAAYSLLSRQEHFGGGRGSAMASASTAELLSQFIAFVLVLLLLLVFGKFLWNEFMVKYVTILKPIPSVIDLLAISLLLRLFL
jgi:hypothetical protein